MARKIRARNTTATVHYQICRLHGDVKRKKCWGTLGRGGTCSNKSTREALPGILPTCKIHRRQLKKPGWCTALLGCGYPCGALLEWELHGLQLCSRHRASVGTCCFLRVPVEIRNRIYGLLLPDTDVPARFSTSRFLTTRGDLVDTAILRVNHQIHEEATRCLYASNVFTIEVAPGTMYMCNLPDCGGYVSHRLLFYKYPC
jgi:hypothetical protein